MPRYTFGGELTQLITEVNADLTIRVAPGATVPFYRTPTGGSVETDYMLDPGNDGVFESAAASIAAMSTGYLPPFQGPDGVTVLYYDPDPTDTDVRRVMLISWDYGVAGVPQMSTTQSGTGRLATTAEIDDPLQPGHATALLTPAGARRQIDAHDDDTAAHPGLKDAIDALVLALADKASLNSDRKVGLELLPAAVAATVNSLIVRDPVTAAAAVGPASLDGHAIQRGQVTELLRTAGGAGTDVRHRAIASGSLPVTVTNSTTLVDIPTLLITDARSLQVWRVDYDLCFHGIAAGGVRVQFKAPVAAVTNLLPNPSFETDVSGWSANAPAGTPVRDTAQGGAVTGSAANMKITTTGTSVAPLILSQWFPYTLGDAYSVGVYCKRSSTTGRPFRSDAQFGLASAVDYATSAGVISGIGANSTAVTSTTAYQQAKVENVSTTDATAAKIRVRLAIQASSTGDVHHFDAAQLEKGATLPAYGSTGGSGSGSLTGVGSMNDPVAYARPGFRGAIVPMLAGLLGATTDAWITGSFLMTVGGTDLINQTIGLQFAQANANATSTQLVEGNATFALVA